MEFIENTIEVEYCTVNSIPSVQSDLSQGRVNAEHWFSGCIRTVVVYMLMSCQNILCEIGLFYRIQELFINDDM